jgi:transposase-like protein
MASSPKITEPITLYAVLFTFDCPHCSRPNLQKKTFIATDKQQASERFLRRPYVCTACRSQLGDVKLTALKVLQVPADKIGTEVIEPEVDDA